jgi:YD repeat-containing protein
MSISDRPIHVSGGRVLHVDSKDILHRVSFQSQKQQTTMTFDALSRRTAMTLPNGTQTTYSYDPASQVTQILHQLTAIATQINQAAYAYNPVGNRTSLTDRRGPQAFGYDQLDRLTSASHPLLATPQAFAYDAVGNRTTGGSVMNAGNQLTADATHSYQYDDNGCPVRLSGRAIPLAAPPMFTVTEPISSRCPELFQHRFTISFAVRVILGRNSPDLSDS